MAEAAPLSEATCKIRQTHIECPICCDRFTDPKILDCLHCFCFNCLEELVEKQDPKTDNIICPVCRQETTVPDKGLSSLANCLFLEFASRWSQWAGTVKGRQTTALSDMRAMWWRIGSRLAMSGLWGKHLPEMRRSPFALETNKESSNPVIMNVLELWQFSSYFLYTSAYVQAIRHGVTGPLHNLSNLLYAKLYITNKVTIFMA